MKSYVTFRLSEMLCYATGEFRTWTEVVEVSPDETIKEVAKRVYKKARHEKVEGEIHVELHVLGIDL